MGRDAVMAAIAKQSGRTPEPDRPKPEFSPMQSLRQVFSGTIFDPRSRQNKRERDAGYADGGRVRPRGFVAGPGTGTSDSIKARLSDGEYVLPADTVQAVGVDALDALKDATHTPVAKPDKNRAGEPLERAASSQTTTAWFRVTGARRRVCRQPRQIGNCRAWPMKAPECVLGHWTTQIQRSQ